MTLNVPSNVRRVGKVVAGLPVAAGFLVGTYFTLIPHPTGVPGEPSAIVTTSGVDCLLGAHVASSCPALAWGFAYLLLSLFVGYFVYYEAAPYLIAVATLLVVTGIVPREPGNWPKVMLSSALLLAVGAVLMQPTIVTDRLHDVLNGRIGAR